MKYILTYALILLLTLSSACLHAQTKTATPLTGRARIDSLQKELVKAKEDTNKCNILSDLSFAYINVAPDSGITYGRQDSAVAARLDWKKGVAAADNSLGLNYSNKTDYATALAYHEKALRLSGERCDKKGIAAATNFIGTIYRKQSDYPRALEYYFNGLKMAEELGDKNVVARNTGNIGLVYQYQSDYPRALEYFFRSLKIFEETGDKSGMAINTGNIGIVYSYQSDFPRALEYYFKSLKIDEELGDRNNMAMNTGNIGNVYLQLADYPRALEYHFKALKMCEELGDKSGVAKNTGNIGNVYYAEHNYTQAVAWHFNAFRIAAEIGERRDEAIDLASIGDDYTQIAAGTNSESNVATPAANTDLPVAPYLPDSLIPHGRAALLHKAVDYLGKAITIDKEIHNLTFLQGCYEILSTADSLLGDYKGALSARSLYELYKDSVFSQENNKKIVQQQMKDEYGRREDSIKLVSCQSEIVG